MTENNAVNGKHNVRRRYRMIHASDRTLADFVKARTLSSAAAFYELKRRGKLQLLAAS